MIYYTVIPAEELFDEEEERSMVVASVKGCSVLVEPLGDGRGRIERLLSTDPADYLSGELQPGRVVDLTMPTTSDVISDQ